MESSSRVRRPDDKEDIISSLPDSLIHNIFKFMDMKQVIATSLLSERWRSLWVSSPYLNFMLDPTSERRDDQCFPLWDDGEYCDEFDNFVDQVLLSRDHTSQMQAFCIENYPSSLPRKVDVWVHHAVSRNVQEVKLESVYMDGKTVEFLCANVKCLTLNSVSIACEEEGEELLLNCPIMETLVLHDCFGDDWTHNVKLSAPILKVLKFEGGLFYNCTIDNLSSIVTAMVHINIWLGKDDDREDFLDNILRGLTNAKYLTFSLYDLPACSKVPITLNTVATFQSLRYLKLTTVTTRSTEGIFCFSTSLKLLEKCPVIETLVLDGFLSWEHEIMEENLVVELQSWCKRCHLKTLEIEGRLVINDCAFKFIKCIMRNAASLKNVVLTTRDTPREQEKFVNICKRLKVKPKVTKVSSQRIQVSLKPSPKIQWKSV